MNEEQARTFIVEELASHRSRNDMLMVLCRELDIDWEKAEQLVRDVETYQGQTIARRQSPFLMLLGAGIIIAGMALTIDAALYFWEVLQIQTLRQLLSLQFSYVMAGSFITGVAMITGGAIGFKKIFAKILN
jgi:hypothetical protein